MFRLLSHPPARPRAARTLLAGLAVAAMLAAGALLPTDAARATEVYRYKDPFGVWRAMKVPNGYAKYYKRAQVRTALRGSRIKVCLDCEPRSGDGASLLTLGDRAARWGAAPPSTAHDELIAQAARDSGVDRALLTAVIAVESGFRSDARSPKGALGLMQLMPATAATLLARGLEMPEAVRQGLAHADAAVAASFLPGMGRRIPNRIQPQ